MYVSKVLLGYPCSLFNSASWKVLEGRMITVNFKQDCPFTIHNIPFGVFTTVKLGGDVRRVKLKNEPILLSFI